MKFEVYREGSANKLSTILTSGSGDWRWRLLSDNNRIIATGGEGYKNRGYCLHGIQLVMSATAATTVYDQEAGRSFFYDGNQWI